MKISRAWAMPSPDTFSIPPIGEFVRRYAAASVASVDPFARNSKVATITNDINPAMGSQHHMDAVEFLKSGLAGSPDLVLLDMPYSPRQISECYKACGLKVTMSDTQSASLYRRVKDAVDAIATTNATVLTFGWNTVGMGKTRGWKIEEILLVCHGGAHNDTICMAETRAENTLFRERQ